MDSLLQAAAQYASKGLLIDTNLLLLYGVGLHDRRHVARFKRTNQYTVEDFEIVSSVVRVFHRIVTTPHILAEL